MSIYDKNIVIIEGRFLSKCELCCVCVVDYLSFKFVRELQRFMQYEIIPEMYLTNKIKLLKKY